MTLFKEKQIEQLFFPYSNKKKCTIEKERRGRNEKGQEKREKTKQVKFLLCFMLLNFSSMMA